MREVIVTLLSDEVAALRAGGVKIAEVGRRTYRVPEWAADCVDGDVGMGLLEDVGRAVARGLDPAAVQAALSLGGWPALHALVEAA